ncbi:MAG: superoxide dismutase family protein [Terrimicrobiaceae bacterium]
MTLPTNVSAVGKAVFFAWAIAGLVPVPCLAADEKVEKVMDAAPIIADAVDLIAVLRPTEGNKVAGTVNFSPVDGGKVEIIARVTGLKPLSEHGFHIHQYGDLSTNDGMSMGDHYNPVDHEHGLLSQAVRHAGDFGNLKADAQGAAILRLVVDNLSPAGQKNPIIGRGVVVHAKADDGSQPSGNAGARIAVGVIGVRNPSDRSNP